MKTANDRLIEFKQELSVLLKKHKAEISLILSESYSYKIQVELSNFHDDNGNYNEYIREEFESFIDADKLK